MAIFWLFYLGLVHQVYSDTSSDDLTRCPSRCDTLKELDTLRMDINVLRQLLNQESIIRMNLEEKIQNQQKLIDDMAKEINFVNRSTEEIILETRKLHSEVQEMVGNQSVSSLDTQTNISSLWNSLRTQGQEIHDVNSDTKTNISSLWNSLRTQGQELHNVNSETKANMSSLWNSVKTQGLDIRDLQTERNRTIAFTVSSSLNLQNYNHKIIVYDKVFTNKGAAYNTNTGIFTCPTTGTYVFTWSTMSGSDSQPCTANIYHNGNRLLMTYSDEAGGSYHEIASNTLVLTLTMGDRVWIQTETGTYCYGYPYTGFSGWKI